VGAELLFQIVTQREERAFIAIGNNLPSANGGSLFPDPRLVAAIVCRPRRFDTGTESYRLHTSKTTTRGKRAR
jgi:hypothetical protein